MNTRQNPSFRATKKFIRLRETSLLLLHNTCSIHTKVTRFASLLLLPFCFLSIFPANERTMRRRWFRLSRKECGKVKKEQEEEEDDKRNEKNSVNPKIESAALSWPPWSSSSFRCCCCCCCKKTISKQREIGSRMSRTSFSFSIKKQNKTKYFSFLFFYFLHENLNVTGFNNNNKAPAMAYREICKRK